MNRLGMIMFVICLVLLAAGQWAMAEEAPVGEMQVITEETVEMDSADQNAPLMMDDAAVDEGYNAMNETKDVQEVSEEVVEVEEEEVKA